ncbi:MAG: hypothetical protein HKM89_09950 [Gemmatimonadales bacterium]|nr:hypothetical protein [Gemmatimonadales bacterium]
MRTALWPWLSVWIVILAAISTVGSTAESQTRVREQRLRIRTLDDPSTVTEAWYAGQTADTLYVVWVTSQHGKPEAVPFERIGTLERSRGMKSHALQGMVVGLGVGAIASLALSSENCGGSNQDDVGSCLGQGMVLLGVPGVALGALVGAVYRTERWEKVPTYPLPVQVGFLPGSRIGVGLSLGI